MELFEIDAQRHRHHVGGPDPVELRPGERGGAHDGVEIGGRAAVGGVCDSAGEPARKDLSHQPIESFVGDHHGGHGTAASPRAQRTEREPVRDFQRIGPQFLQKQADRSGQYGPVAARERNQPGGQRDPYDARRHLVAFGFAARNHQVHLVAGRAVFRTQAIHGGTQPTRARPVEVGDLHDPHSSITTGAHVRSRTPGEPSPEWAVNTGLPRAGC